tara:strand:+ start:26 stop:1117 length:1092 start_codon:yes stop_codon:yes gene_type:complete
MKKTLLTLLSVFMLSSFAFSQCVPNTDFTGILGLDSEAYESFDQLPFDSNNDGVDDCVGADPNDCDGDGVYYVIEPGPDGILEDDPDTAEVDETLDNVITDTDVCQSNCNEDDSDADNDGILDEPGFHTFLKHATVGCSYETFFDMRIPMDTAITYDLGQGPQDFDPVYLTTIAVNSVNGLPMGFDWECASQDPNGEITGDNCTFPGGGYGCLRLFSNEVENVVGTYPIVVALDIVAEYEVFGVSIPVEVTDDSMLNYLVLHIEEGDCGLSNSELVDSRSFNSLGTYPNPFNNSANIHFGNDKNSEVLFSVYDLLGNLVYTEKIQSVIGHNEYVFERGGLVSGLYTYTLFNGDKSISKNIIIQ